MKEITGETPEGITLIFGSGDNTVVAYNYINRNSVDGQVIFITDNRVNPDILLVPENVIIFSPKDYQEMGQILDLVKSMGARLKCLVIDSISGIYRREMSSRRRLAPILNRIKQAKVPTLITVESYRDFSTGEMKINAKDLLYYIADKVVELKVEKGIKKAYKYVPNRQCQEYKVSLPLLEVEIENS